MKQFKGIHFNRQELSGNQFVDNKAFVDCVFEHCNLAGYTFTNCEFTGCQFIKCNFSNAFLAMNKGYAAGKFDRCVFADCNLTAASFRFPEIDHCEFNHCKLLETNFDGSRFSHTRFTGILHSCLFMGHSMYAAGRFFSLRKFDARKYPNKMVQVDFSQAKLISNIFSNNIHLSSCIFPTEDAYLFVRDLRKTMTQALDYIRITWREDRDKELAIALVKNIYFTKDMQEQPHGFYDNFFVRQTDKQMNNDLGMRLFEVLKSFS